MKKIYWRPRAVSRTALVLIAVTALAGLVIVEQFKVIDDRPFFDEKLQASELASRAFDVIYDARLATGPPIDLETDPAQSGLIGLAMSPVTSISGNLAAKQASADPNFAAVILEMLKRLDVGKGDVVAVGCSGSFPSLNMCVYAALETLEAKPLVITSAAASQWGANVPDLLWLDMERILVDQGVFKTKSVAVSIGGYEDRGLGLSDEGLKLLKIGIQRSNVEHVIEPITFEDSIVKRMDLYEKLSGRRTIKAYINIGGNMVSTGRRAGKRMFHPGVNRHAPGRVHQTDGVMPRFANRGVPIVHLVQIVALSERYGLYKIEGGVTPPGEGAIYRGIAYNNGLVLATLLFILASLYGFIRSDIGFRLLRVKTTKTTEHHPEPMV